MKRWFIIFFFLGAANLNAQFLDAFTLFKPQFSVKGSYIMPADDGVNSQMYESSVSLFAPVSSRLDVKMDWKGLLKVKKLSDLRNIPSIDAQQVFTRFKLGYRVMENDLAFMDGRHEIGVGSFGMTWLRLRSKPKLKLTVTHLNIAFSEDINFTSAIPNITFLYGKMRIFSLRTFGFIGVAAGNSNTLPYATPVLAVSTFINSKIQAMVALPIQAKIVFKLGNHFKQSIVCGLGGFSNGVSIRPDTISDLKRHYYSHFQLRASTQSSIKLGSNAKLYLEAGYTGLNRLRIRPLNDYVYAMKPGPFVQLSFNYSFARGIFNSETFELDL